MSPIGAGKYEFTKLLFRSSESEVYLARRRNSDDRFLIKTLCENRSNFQRQVSLKKRFKQEVDLASSFTHPYISRLVDSFESRNSYCLVYPHRAGNTLAHFLDTERTIPLNHSVNMMMQLLNALEYIHSRGIIHCDINPKNIFLTDSNEIELFDFGCSLSFEEAMEREDGQMLGTPPYIAPEQLGLTDFKIDSRTDLFCAGIIFYRLVTGRVPFHALEQTLDAYADLILKTEVLPMKNAPLSFNQIVMKALKPTPGERYQTAAGFIHDLKVALQHADGEPLAKLVVGEQDSIISVNSRKIFVGREMELEMLEKGLMKLFSGGHSSHLFYGPSGIGKTEMVKRFKMNVKRDRFNVLSTKCNRFTANLPFSVLRDLMMELLSHLSGSSKKRREDFTRRINKDLAEYSGLICRVIPEMEALFHEIAPPDEIEKEKEADRLVQVLFRLMCAIAEVRPLVVFIDDLQWADDTSFQVFRRLLEEQIRCMLIFNFRTEESKADLYVSKQDLRRLPISTMRLIGPFTKPEVEEMIALRFGELEHAATMIDALCTRTDLAPYTLDESIRFLVNNSILKTGQEGWYYSRDELHSLPETFDAISLIYKKLEYLPENARRYLQIASLLEGFFQKDIIEKVGRFDKGASTRVTYHLEKEGFIARRIKGGYYFLHDKLKESVAASLTKAEKLTLNENLARIYEKKSFGSREFLFPAAEHYLKSADLVQSILACTRAAGYAREKMSFDLAIHYYKLAVFMAAQCPKVHLPIPIDLFEARMALGDVYMLTGHNKEALEVFGGLLKDGNAGNENKVLELKYKVGSIYHNMGEFEKSIPHLKDSLCSLNIRFPKTRFGLYINLAFETLKLISHTYGLKYFFKLRNDSKMLLKVRTLNKLSYSLYFDDMIECLFAHFKSLNISDHLIESYEKNEAVTLHGAPAYQLLRKKRSFKFLSMAISSAKILKRPDSYALARSINGMLHYYSAQWKESESNFQESISTFAGVGDLSSQIVSREHIWRILLIKGSFNEISQHLSDTEKICEQTKEKHFLASTLAADYLVRLVKTGIPHEIILNRINELLQNTTSFLTNSHVEISLLQAEILQDQYEAAYARIEKILPGILKKSFNSEYIVPAFSLFCELLTNELLNRRKGVKKLPFSDKEVIRKLKTNCYLLRFSCISFPAYRGAYLRTRAWQEAFKGRAKTARQYFKCAIAEHHGLEMKYEEAKSVRDLGIFLEDFCNIPGNAKDLFYEAYALFSGCGAKLDQEKLKAISIQVASIEGGISEPARITEYAPTLSSDTEHLRVDALCDVSNSITEFHDIDTLLAQTVKALIKATGAQNGFLFLEPYDNRPEKKLFMNFQEKKLHETEVTYANEIITWVRTYQRPALVSDGRKDERIENGKNKNIRSVLCMPMLRNENYLGCVYLSNDRITGLFSDYSRKAAQILTTQVSILLENAYLLDNYKKLNSRLEMTVIKQTTDIRKKNEQLARSNLQLVESERMKTILSHTVVHDIKNYIAGIEGNLKVLTRKYAGEPKGMRSVNAATGACMDVMSLASNLLDIARMEEGRLDLKTQNVAYREIEPALSALRKSQMFEEKEISFEIIPPAGPFEIECDYSLFNRVIQNLVNNAAKYTPSGGNVSISFECGENENIIAIFNTGEAIKPEYRDTLFEKYSRAGGKWSQYSKGLGLFFCRMVMNAHKGKIWLDTSDNGNHFKLSFPKSRTLLSIEENEKNAVSDRNT